MKCKYCGNELEQGRIEVKAISGNGLAYPLISYIKNKGILKNRLRLKEKETGYYCNSCGIVFSEYHIVKGK